MSESTPGSQKKGVPRVNISSQEESQQMQSGILSRLPGDQPTNKASGTIDENKNTRADSGGYKTMERSTLHEPLKQSKFTMRSSYNNESIQPKLKCTGKGPPKVLHRNNNQQSAASIRQYGISKHVSLQGYASIYRSEFDTSAGSNKLKSNGEYEISKQGRVWCIRDLKTNKLTTLKNIKAYEVFFESKELVSVDGVFHQLIVHNGKKPKLEIAERSSSSSSEDDSKPNASDASYGSKSDDDYSETRTTQNSLPESEEPSSRFQKQPNITQTENAMACIKAGAGTDLFKDTADVEEFLGSQDSISSNESLEIIDSNEADCKEQEKIEKTTQSELSPDGTFFEFIDWMHPKSKSEAAQVQKKPLSNDQFCIKVQGSFLTVQDKHNPRCKLVLPNANDAHFEGDLLCVDGSFFYLFVEDKLLKSYKVQRLNPSGDHNDKAVSEESLLGQETKMQVEKQGNHCSDFGSQSVKQKRKEYIINHVPMIVVKIILQHSFKTEFSTKFPDAEYKAENVNGYYADIRIFGSCECLQWFQQEIHYCQTTFKEVRNGTIPKLPDIVENYLSNSYGKLGTVLWDIVPEERKIFVWCSSTSPYAEEVIFTLKRAIKKAELSFDCNDSALAKGRKKIRKRYNVLHEEVYWNTEGQHTLRMFCFQKDYEDIKKEMQNIFQYQRTTHEESGHSTDAIFNDHRALYSIVNGKDQTITVSNEEVVNLKTDAIVVLKEKESIGDASKYFDCDGIQKQDEAPPFLPPRNPIDSTTTVVKSKALGNPLPAYTQSPKNTEKGASGSTHDSTRPRSSKRRNKLRVKVLKDDIINVTADVIVNSTSVDLILDRGHVSSHINKLAGTELQKAVYRKAKDINFWEYIVTPAFDLSNCKHIFHCALEPLNDNDGTKQEQSCLSKMRATVQLLLNEANRMSCNSIALPALGTGYLGYKSRDAATAMFLAVCDFVQVHGDRSHLEDIKIVIYQTEENTFQAFKKVEAEMKPELATLTTRF